MRLITALALGALALPLAAAAETTYPINPGYWELNEDWLGLIKKTERVCVEPHAITKFVSAPCNHIYHCNYPVQRMGDGKIYFEGTWSKTGELYHVRGGGAYTPTTLDLKVSGHGHWNIVPVPSADASIHATFIGADCPVDAKRYK
jgi:hypothetical protein